VSVKKSYFSANGKSIENDTKLPKCSKTLHFQAAKEGETGNFNSEQKTNKTPGIRRWFQDFAV
jgi:hypothetical protein